MRLDDAIREAYGPRLREALTDPDGTIRATWAAEEAARREALGPEGRELEDLKRENAALRYRLELVQRVLNGEEFDD